jgi:hypothetical protein
MSRRTLAALALVASSAFAACAEPITAPRQPLVAPSAPRHDALVASACKSGWISTEGRCG